MLIYLAVNRVNQKAYVGQTRGEFSTRISNHITFSNVRRKTTFHKALHKYGCGAFDFAILERCSDQASLDAAEIKWIAHIGSHSRNGYNSISGGQGASGVVYTEERREKIRQSQLGDRNRMRNPETAKKHGMSIRGERHQFFGKFGAEHPRFGARFKLSEKDRLTRKRTTNTPEFKEGARLRMLARQTELNTPEMKAKRSESLRRYWNSEEGKQRQSSRMIEAWKRKKEKINEIPSGNGHYPD